MPAMPAPAMAAPDWARLVLLSLLWGGSFLFVALALAALPPLTLALARVAGAAAVLAGVMAALRLRFPPRGAWPALAVMGLLNNALPFAAIAAAQVQIDAGLAAILNATTPLFGVVVAAAARAERATARRVLGVGCGIAGVAAMAGGGAGAPAAMALCLAAALSYALAGVWGRRLAALGLAPPAAAFGMLTAAALVLLPAALLIDRPWTLPPPGAGPLAAVVALAVLSTAAAYLLYFRLLADVGAVNLLSVTFLIPVSALLLGILVLGERPGPAQAAGLMLIAAGLWCVGGGGRKAAGAGPDPLPPGRPLR